MSYPKIPERSSSSVELTFHPSIVSEQEKDDNNPDISAWDAFKGEMLALNKTMQAGIHHFQDDLHKREQHLEHTMIDGANHIAHKITDNKVFETVFGGWGMRTKTGEADGLKEAKNAVHMLALTSAGAVHMSTAGLAGFIADTASSVALYGLETDEAAVSDQAAQKRSERQEEGFDYMQHPGQWGKDGGQFLSLIADSATETTKAVFKDDDTRDNVVWGMIGLCGAGSVGILARRFFMIKKYGHVARNTMHNSWLFSSARPVKALPEGFEDAANIIGGMGKDVRMFHQGNELSVFNTRGVYLSVQKTAQGLERHITLDLTHAFKELRGARDMRTIESVLTTKLTAICKKLGCDNPEFVKQTVHTITNDGRLLSALHNGDETAYTYFALFDDTPHFVPVNTRVL